jgi:hypothetical protein
METRCVVVGPAASELSVIAREAADAQMRADEIEAYLRSNGSPNWQSLAAMMDYLRDDVLSLQKSIYRFEQSEPRLTEAQSQQLERLRTGLSTLTVFVNNTYQLIGEQQLLPHRKALISNARAMSVRADFIRNAARNLRTAEGA